MARRNTAPVAHKVYTHEGAAAAAHLTPEQQLRRSVMSSLLWEDQFYEDGQSIADRISKTAELVPPPVLARMAYEARTKHNLRHVPLLMLDTLAKTGRGHPEVSDAVEKIIQRPDEMGELISIHWRNGKKMIPAQMRKGIARAFGKFDEYQLAKYDRDDAIKLRDVLRLCRPKPVGAEQSELFKRVKDRTLVVPDTWEVELSAGKDKKATFERLIREKKLGYLALLRNLRNMAQAGVDNGLVEEAIRARKGGAHRVLPFRFIAAARHAPQYANALDDALLANVDEMPQFPGKTTILVDVSGSMTSKVSGKSEISRADAAAALASIFPGDRRVVLFHNSAEEVPAWRGLAGVERITRRVGGGTDIGGAVRFANRHKSDRLVVITDEQSHTDVPDPSAERAYMINVASNENGVGYGRWTHIDGFSENVLRFMSELEDPH